MGVEVREEGGGEGGGDGGLHFCYAPEGVVLAQSVILKGAPFSRPMMRNAPAGRTTALNSHTYHHSVSSSDPPH